jgi:hypothetical protein
LTDLGKRRGVEDLGDARGLAYQGAQLGAAADAVCGGALEDAAAFLLGVTMWFALNQPADDPTLADAMRPADAPASFLSASEPDNELVLQVVLER